MLWCRSLLFNILYFCFIAALSIVWMPSLILPHAAPQMGFRIWAYGTRFLLRYCVGVTYDFKGTPPAPGVPVIVAGKHQSAWETIMLSLILDRPAFVLKRELTWIPIFGWYVIRLGMIPIDRGGGSKALRSIIKEAKVARDNNRHIVIFPEGTRVGVDDAKPYQPGVAALYNQLKLPVVPLALNSGLKWPRKAFLKTPGVITAEFLEPIAPGMRKADFMAALEAAVEPRTRALVAAERARMEAL